MVIRHDVGASIECTESGDSAPRWTYVYGGKPKPFFHPLRTPAGSTLSLFEPFDHVWHRGLWFTIKFINGENFWEEHPPFGTQEPGAPMLVPESGDGLRMTFVGAWRRPGGEAVIVENRNITYRPLSADRYALDWEVALKPDVPVLLDRTPFTTWGGYGGLTFRGNRNWMKTRLLFEDGTTSDRPTPKPSKWCDLSGKFDGGSDLAGGVAIFDHPENVRHPAPWYGATGAGHYFNAAFLFNEPMTLKQGEQLHLRYRVLVHDGIPDAGQLNAAYGTWLKGAR